MRAKLKGRVAIVGQKTQKMKPGEHFMPNKGELLTVILDYVGVPMRVQCSFLGLMELVGGGLDALLFEDPLTIYRGCFRNDV